MLGVAIGVRSPLGAEAVRGMLYVDCPLLLLHTLKGLNYPLSDYYSHVVSRDGLEGLFDQRKAGNGSPLSKATSKARVHSGCLHQRCLSTLVDWIDKVTILHHAV